MPSSESSTYVESFLRGLHCQEYLPAFQECDITTKDDLIHLDKSILIVLGINKIGDRLRILKKIRTLKPAESISTTSTAAQLDAQFNELLNKFESLSPQLLSSITPSSYYSTVASRKGNKDDEIGLSINDKHHVIFILNDGSAMKVNVNGCFNADSIKKRLIKKLIQHQRNLATNRKTKNAQDYDIFVVDYNKNVLHLLYDVELVTICHSPDRLDKNRLIFVAKDQTPSDQAIQTSKKLYLKTMNSFSGKSNSSHTSSTASAVAADVSKFSSTSSSSRMSVDNDDDKGKIRKIFNQRPPSELISTNLSNYFPNTNMTRLKKTIRDSYRQSVRLSTASSNAAYLHSHDPNNIGDILLKRANAIDRALLQSISQNSSRVPVPRSSLDPRKGKSILSNKGHGASDVSLDRIRLMSSEEEDNDDDYYDDDDNTEIRQPDLVSLPTKVVTPKSWLKGARIGSGSFGTVYLGMDAATGELMAVKQVEIKPLVVTVTTGVQLQSQSDDKISKDTKQQQQQENNQSDIHKKMVDALQHEMNLLKELHHENIVTYYGSSQENGNLNIFLEYVPGGSISTMLNNYGPFEESLIINFIRQVLIGVAYLHRKNIIHRDIKGANILIDTKGCVKITDFGISKKLSSSSSSTSSSSHDKNSNNNNKRASLQGSVYWMAPEVVKQTVTTTKVDIWSTGCVIIEMFTGKHPFPDFSQMQTIFKIGTNTTPEIPSWATEEGKDFLRKTFEIDYKKRPDAIELLQHPWVDSLNL
ncbi:mitogen-activated protein kinase kinase kinase STE11 NDAI_0J01990 [Naumovozyma dairenensis CBS 421]|uniref:Serine/threonine-protein kinase STE11 n=1 Tax=Naumovozyma dairenensis (strain ATCC 10597 / BCRC 20456 / CBS 421 / NBRC 0211 / NRRL Y-12639) TaxID=1071378 RepID=G0WH13_NAUDC|nr:hypothetical protein NDAI_0J01990 [Naumovozyma dairenensis CBS 421]CCD27091.1 hypothetical protein NDAI_0J01990 [Naumovozyma dairenensis CBS 421]